MPPKPNAAKSRALDAAWMRRALRLAERGRGSTAPNPIVGAVVVKGGRVLGEGWHRALGRDHAEVEALRRAGRAARGATLYVTLEPCTHWGRTPPCTDAILAAGIARCVVATRDPDPRVNGRGLRRLRSAGVRVERGLLAHEADDQLAGYRRAHLAGLPRVTWKVAATLDGRIADAHGRSRWITGAAARADGHRLRAEHDAIVVGAGTARSDDPRLTARTGARVQQPLRVIVDSKLRLDTGLRVFSRALAAGTVVACTRDATLSRERMLVERGVRVWRLAATSGRVSPAALARRLVAEGCHDVLLEGGATLGASWLRSSLVQRVVLYSAPLVLGGGRAWCDGPARSLADAVRGRVVSVARVGDDTRTLVELED